MGIKVNAIVNSYSDIFLSQNADFQVVSSEGATIASFACPSQENFSRYIASIATEVSHYPIDGLILDDLALPNKRSCFCDRCRRLFASKWNIERDFSFEYLESKDLLTSWNDDRATYINQTLKEVTDTVKGLKNIDISIVMKTDKETDTLIGSHEHFGQNIVELAKITNNLILHINPWSGITSKDDPAYQQLLTSLSILGEYSGTGIKPSLYFWDITSPEKLETAIKLKDDLKAERVFIDSALPMDFTKRRTINLGF